MAQQEELVLWIDQRWKIAIEKNLNGETLQEYLENVLDELCDQLPEQEYERISHEIQSEAAARRAVEEAARTYAAYHVTEHGQEWYFKTSPGEELLEAGKKLRSYITKGSGTAPDKFIGMFFGGQPITAKEFDDLTALRMENTGKVRGVFDVNFDEREFSAVNIMDGWQCFRIKDVSTAAYFAMKKGNAAPDERWRIFLDRLEERALNQEPEPEYLTGSRRLCAEDISFAEDIIQNDNLLEFYMEVSFNADQVFGTDVCTSENDDWLNIYANYDLDARRVCDTLEVYLQRGNGDEGAFKYRLSPEEQALLLPKMNAYCQEHWSQTLEECSADYLAEQSQELPEMQM